MTKGQIVLAILLLLSIVSCFLPWLTASVSVDGEDRSRSTTNYGYQYLVPMGVLYTAPVAILSIIGFVLSAYSFKATEKVRRLNMVAGVMILVGAIAAFAYTFTAALGEANGSLSLLSFSVNVSADYGMGLELLTGFLMIIVAWRTHPETV
jgi:hypothetical protein